MISSSGKREKVDLDGTGQIQGHFWEHSKYPKILVVGYEMCEVTNWSAAKGSLSSRVLYDALCSLVSNVLG